MSSKTESKPAPAAKAKLPKKEASTPPPPPTNTTKADAVAEDLEALDDDIIADLYGKEHLNVVFMGHVGKRKHNLSFVMTLTRFYHSSMT